MNLHINSGEYWNTRFAEDWSQLSGPEQSVFFAKLTYENLPDWLISQIREKSFRLADWGCAEGDGTQYWAENLAPAHFTGVDFSQVAIQLAQSKFSAAHFACQDWLTSTDVVTPKFDIVFSSNTLEHFTDPLPILEMLGERAEKAVVLALPFKEMDRIDEHFYTFLPANIPLTLKNGFSVVWSKVVNCKNVEGAFWGGEQIVLVYAQPEWIAGLSLNLQDSYIYEKDPGDQEQVITEHLGRVAQMTSERERLFSKMGELAEDRDIWKEKALEMSSWGQRQVGEIAALNDRVKSLQDSPFLFFVKKWIRRSFSFAKKNTKRLLSFARKCARRFAKFVYHALPVSLEKKQGLRTYLRKKINLIAKKTQIVDSISDVKLDNFNLLNSTVEASAGRDVFVFSVIDWHFRIQRPQQLALGFALNGARVFFFSNHFIDSGEPGYQLERIDPSLEIYQIKLHVLGAPAIYFSSPTPEEQLQIEAGIGKVIFDFAALSSVSLVEHAYWYSAVKSLPNTIRVYDCMDHHEGFGNVPEKLLDIEREMMRSADLVVTTSSWLEEVAKKTAANVATVRNACEYDHFCNIPQDVYKDSKQRKIIGYYGAIAEWFDLDLIRDVALANADAVILLVGNDTVNAANALKDLQNVVMTGEVPYKQLPFYLHAFDVCLLPFKVIPLTLATNPVKVYEYLAAGKSVVSVDLPEMEQFGSLVATASSSSQFVAAVKAALQAGPGELIEERKAFAAQQTWRHRATEFNSAVAMLKFPKISVVVLTYNNLELTKDCLSSLLTRSHYPNLEIIVVDNASTDGSDVFLKEFGETHPNVHIILNAENVGFAAGNNIGLAAATGDYLTMVNNDTVLTRGWAMTMMRHLQADPTIGLVGPVTNNIGNEARVPTSYSTLPEMPAEAAFYTLQKMGRFFPIKTAAFFCVMLPRSTYERCGPLCEEYGLGFFEDDDYCRRVEEAGLSIMCCRDVFVHHHLSASFNKIPSRERMVLMERNKAIYETKWGRWIPHEYHVEPDLK